MLKVAHLAAGETRNPRVASLRSRVTFSDPSITVDEKEGVVRNVNLMEIGPAVGHGFELDARSIGQLVALIAAKPDGVKMRFKHPKIDADGTIDDTLGTLIGCVRNPRVDGNCARGDIYLGSYAKSLPGLGDVWTYILGVAKERPTDIGLSAVIGYDVDPVMDAAGNVTAMPARIFSVDAVDLVGQGAATPNGLLSASSTPKPTTPGGTLPKGASSSLSLRSVQMDEYLKSLLREAGCAQDASDDTFQAFHDSLSAEKQSELAAKVAAHKATMAAAPEPDDGRSSSGLSALVESAVQATLKALNVDPKAIARLNAARATRVPPTPQPRQVDDGDALLALETKRVAQLKAMAKLHAIPDGVLQKSIGENHTVAQAREAFLRHVHETAKPVDTTGYNVTVGQDNNVASLRAAIPQAICLRAGLGTEQLNGLEKRSAAERPTAGLPGKVHERAYELAQLSVLDMFRQYLVGIGCQGVYDMSRPKLASLMGPRTLRATFPRIAMLAESTSDFSSITLDAINKTLRFNYLDAPKTWSTWAQRATNSDFKSINRVVLSEAPSLASRNEGGEIKYTALTDSKETYNLAEYVAGIKLTRRAIINDDLDAFNAIPRAQANAAARLEDDQAYGVLTGTTTMSDGLTLFHATHANLISSGTAISLSSMQAMRALLRKQKGLGKAARLELRPKFLLVPTSIEAIAENFINSEKFVATSGAPTAGGEGNPFYKSLTLVPSTRLDDASTTAWYLLADPRDGQVNGAEVCFLTDEPEPVIRSETDFDSEDVKYLVRHTVAAKAIDFRAFAKNVGA